MLKYPIFLQDNENSCGAYCIKMLLSFYKRDDEIKNIKKRCRLTKEGVTVYGLIQVLKEYHLEAKAYQCEFKHLFEEVNCPAIVHLKQDDLYHYVILYKVKDGYFLVGDPAKGLIKMSYESFSKQFTGIIIMIDHVGMPITKRTSYTFQNFLKDHFKQHYQTIIKMMIKTIIISMLTMIFSYYYQLMIDSFSKYPIYQIVFISLGFTVLYAFKLLLDYLRRQQILELSRELNQEYALKTMQNLIYQDYDYMDGLEKGTLLSRSQNLFELSQYFIEFYHVIFIDSILMLFILIFILSIQFFLFLIVLLMMVIIFLVFYFYSKKLHIENKKILEQKEHLNDGLLEFQENYFQTIQFKVKKMMKNKLGYLYDNYFMDVYHHDEITNRHQIQLEALIQIMIMVVLLFSIFIYKKQQMTLGTVMLVYLLLSYMIDPLMKISVFIAMHDELQIIFERYKEMLPEKRERKKKIKKIKSIELKHVSFSYGYTRPLFDHFQLKIERSLFIQGKTGSGKSTLLKLIMNQLQPTKGEIVINGINLQELDLNSYYSHIKYLNKTPVFYKESLRTNMIFDRLFLENKMIELLHYFMLDDLVNGLDLKLDEQGGFLSSGQGQLVMIIRALLSEPDVLILDEAFSNIDQERLQLLINYLSFQKIIVIIVSHQINMMNCQFDCVIIDSGKIVGEEDYGNRFST
ncbi:MAG: cysteine peptidase family C39 domain-containing protein [Faecalibacillus intestinalis]|jgi:ABC-type bacteriocin/lantibiotic exporter with double-glycine peptidase domain|uniref:cysteine peptidase family C39 domain-containing protein n=1 Tax=Faecalibacillus intestinalis TaxID=1982626 RepID=UPI000E494A06|nr:cysteine peptidase family C39 domain-containing protein [Faecalibacillus intestinalis]RHN85744.1 ATP-binding cassette domain-containing protein [Coprobacillus sp. AM23-2]RHP14871.1 ATP-binding cassette domain-containing protein [Coprobacillus sp. AF35-8]